MAPMNFNYVGKLAIREIGSRERQGIKSIDWTNYPRNYAEKAQDVIGVTGDFGTAAYYRCGAKDMDNTWHELFHVQDPKGNLCLWNMYTPCNARVADSGHLVVGTLATDAAAGKLIMLRFVKNSGVVDQRIIYDAAHDNPDSRQNIFCICWSWDGNSMLVFRENSNTIHSLVWVRNDRHYYNWVGTNMPFDNTDNTYNLIGSLALKTEKEDDDFFAAAGRNTNIKVFRRNEGRLDGNWELICESNQVLGIVSMSFSLDGLALATLTALGRVDLFEIYFPETEIVSIRVIYMIMTPPIVPFTHLRWSRFSRLFVTGGTLQSVVIIEFSKIGGGTPLISHRSHSDVFKGKLGKTPFNSVNQLFVCPTRSKMIGILSHNDVILFWEYGKVYGPRERDLVNEQFVTGIPKRDDKVADFSNQFRENHRGLRTLLLEVSNQVEDTEIMLQNFGATVKRNLEETYEGKEVDIQTILEELYCILKGQASPQD